MQVLVAQCSASLCKPSSGFISFVPERVICVRSIIVN